MSIGDWRKDKIEGEGILYFAMGGYIFGNFYENKIHGYGLLNFPNGDYIIGFWDNGLLNGRAIRYFGSSEVWTLNEYEEGTHLRKCLQGKGDPPLSNLKRF